MRKKEDYLRDMLIIRCFEEALLKLFSENKLFGTTHTCIGQESIAVAAMEHVKDNDIVFSNHRCHGHFIAYSHKPEILLREIMGKAGGMCAGRGGSQHIHYGNFYSNGIQGGIVPNAVGMAWAEKIKKTDNIAIVFLGDGTLGQGIVYESLNIASLKEIPVLFVVEDNGYAMSTSRTEGVGGSIAQRGEAFGIKTSETEGSDVEALSRSFEDAFCYVRSKGKPFFQIVHTYRLAAHSKGDDCREQEEIERNKKKDPITLLKNKLSEDIYNQIQEDARAFIAKILEQVSDEAYEELHLSEMLPQISRQSGTKLPPAKRCVDQINLALDRVLEKHEHVILLGEDIRDPYGGAFKATKGLSTKYPDRVINMPISEAAIAGISVGLALNGIYPIAEIMFGDFISLAFDQLLNHACKYGWMYNESVKVPMIVRAPMGGGRGYGPTHSQSLEKYIAGIPGITVIALSSLHDPVKIYEILVSEFQAPVVMIENKALYAQKLWTDAEGRVGDFYCQALNYGIAPSYLLSFSEDYQADITIITYGGMVHACMEAAEELMLEEEIGVNVFVLGQLARLPIESFLEIGKTIEKVLTVEEGTGALGIGAEIIALLHEHGIGRCYGRVKAPDCAIPNSILQEREVLPGKREIIEKARKLYDEG